MHMYLNIIRMSYAHVEGIHILLMSSIEWIRIDRCHHMRTLPLSPLFRGCISKFGILVFVNFAVPRSDKVLVHTVSSPRSGSLISPQEE